MISSIALLLLLQGLWLINSYDDAYQDLRRRTSDIFRGTLVSMRDSIFQRTIEKISLDSLPRNGGAFFLAFDLKEDSLRHQTFRRRSAGIELGVSKKRSDSIINDKIVIRFSTDTIPTDTIAIHYTAALAKADINLPFTIRVDRHMPPLIDDDVPGNVGKIRKRITRETDDIKTDKGSVATQWMMYSPPVRYAAVFGNIRSFLYLQIGPQILFSIALTLITSAAFWMMYRSMRSQQRLMELKNDFISNITHELKTPVTTVSVALEALRNFKGLENPQTTREYLDIAQGELNRLTILTDKVLKTAVLDNPGVNFETEAVDLRKTVDQILHSMKLIFEKQKARVTFEQQGDSFTIRGGSVHLTNVVYNLLDNALKYSGGDPQISIRLEEDANQVILKIADKGIGIPTEYKKKIFEKFFRVPTGDVHNIKGYGLGLSYVDSVVRSHRGLIEVASKPGEGSVFIISLPKG